MKLLHAVKPCFVNLMSISIPYQPTVMQCACHVLVFLQDVCLDTLLPPTGLVAVREGKNGPFKGSRAKAMALNQLETKD